MRYTTSQSWSGLAPIRRKRVQLNPVIVRDPSFDETLPLPAEDPRIRETVRWKCFNWNAALGIGTIAVISIAGWAGVALLVSSLLEH